MSIVRISCLLLTFLLLQACAGRGEEAEDELKCEPVERYSTSSTIPPVRIPDDLSPPDESESLSIPAASPGSDAAPPNRCLEAPPDFFEDEDTDS